MKKLKNILISAILGVGLAFPSYAQSTDLEQITNEVQNTASTNHVTYTDFADFDSLKIPLNKRTLPQNLAELISDKGKVEVADEDLFYEEVSKVAEKLGYEKEKIKHLKPSRLIKLSADIVKEKMDWVDDGEDELIQKYGRGLPIDQYFHLGKAECQKFADATIAVYNVLKRLNIHPQTKNTYLTRQIGGNILPHEWNSVIAIGSGENQIYCSHIDISNYEDNAPLEATLLHVDPDYFEFRFLYELGDYKLSLEKIDSILSEKTSLETEEKAKLFSYRGRNNVALKKYRDASKDYEMAANLTADKWGRELWSERAVEYSKK